MTGTRHRRSTLQAAGVYIGGGWLAYEILDELTLRLGMPEWVATTALVLLIVGLPVVTLTAWVQGGGAVPLRARLETLLTWRRSVLTGAALFLLLGLGTVGFMTARHSSYGPFGTLFAQGVLTADDPILMADFTSTREPALGRAVAEALRIDLVQSEAIRVADTRFVQDALRRMERDPADGLPAEVARLLAEREGLKAFIRGEVGVLGGAYQLTTELVAVDGTVLDAFRETARDSTQLIDAVDRMSNRLRARVGESLRTIRRGEPLSRVTTSSIAALRLYSEAQQITRTTGDQLRAGELYEQAVAVDSTFGMAWLAVAITLSNVGVRRDDMIAAARRAWQLRDRMPELERWRATATYETYVTNDLRTAAEAYRNVLALDPNNMASRNNLALLLRQMRRDDEAEALLSRAPPAERTATEWLNLVHAQFDQGRIDEARVSLAGMQRYQPEHLSSLTLGFSYATATGDLDGAARALEEVGPRLGGSALGQFFLIRSRAGLAAQQGRVADAVRLMQQGAEAAARLGLQEMQFGVELMTAGGVAFVLDDAPRALRMLEETLRRHDRASMPIRARGHLAIADIYSAAGQYQPARDEIAEYERLVPAAERRAEQLMIDGAKALIELQAGRADAAVPVLRRVIGEGDCRICVLPQLGRAHELLGQPDSAVAAYRAYLDTPFLGRHDVDVAWRPVVLFRLAELYEQRGDTARALEHYAAFADLWRNADPELQPRVEAARRRMAALRAG